MDSDFNSKVVKIIHDFSKTWHLLYSYDKKRLELPKPGTVATQTLTYEAASLAVSSLKEILLSKREASSLFGNERSKGLQNILLNIDQTFSGELLYKSAEEKAAHLMYFIIKNHPFVDGNKRIGSLIFLLYLQLQHITFHITDNGLVALALLVAESDPAQKKLIINLICNMLENPELRSSHKYFP